MSGDGGTTWSPWINVATESYVDQAILALNPVGSVVLRMDAIDPATIYGGTWALITGDASLSFGDGAVRSGVLYGNNTPTVPVPEHSHSLTFDALADHSHSENYATITNGMPDGNADRGANYMVAQSTQESGVKSAGTPSTLGGTDLTDDYGTAGATLDVRGARISINVWQRTA